jgi:hypothetical protein
MFSTWIGAVCILLILSWGVMSWPTDGINEKSNDTLGPLWEVSGYILSVCSVIISVTLLMALRDVTDYKTFKVAMIVMILFTVILFVCITFRVYYIWSGRSEIPSQLLDVSLPISRAIHTTVAVLFVVFCVVIVILFRDWYISPTPEDSQLLPQVRRKLGDTNLTSSTILAAIHKVTNQSNEDTSLLKQNTIDAVVNLLKGNTGAIPAIPANPIIPAIPRDTNRVNINF